VGGVFNLQKKAGARGVSRHTDFMPSEVTQCISLNLIYILYIVFEKNQPPHIDIFCN